MAGYFDRNGIYIYAEDDPWPTTAEVLNVAQHATSDALGPLVLLVPAARAARDVALSAADRAEAAAATLATAGTIIYADPADPGTFLIAAGGPLTEDPADAGTYLIGA